MAVKVDSISATLLLREAYEISYEINDHDRPDAHPWSLVEQTQKEDYSSYSPLYHLFYRYRIRDIQKRWGLSITELLELPREFVDLIFEISKQEDIKDQKTYSEVKEEIDKSTEGKR